MIRTLRDQTLGELMKRTYEKPTLSKAEIRLQGVTAGGPSKVTAPSGNFSQNGSN
jgi:hypothetical protein